MSNLRSDCRSLAESLPVGDVHRVHLLACCSQIDEVEEKWLAAERRAREAEEALAELRSQLPVKRELTTFKGKSQTLRAWAKEYGLSHGTLQDRLTSGWDLEKALTTPVVDYRKHLVCGERMSLRAAAKRWGINTATLHGRMKKGMSLAQAVAKSGVDLSEDAQLPGDEIGDSTGMSGEDYPAYLDEEANET